MNNSPGEQTIRLAGPAELIGTIPTALGYTPGAGNVVVVALAERDRVVLHANIAVGELEDFSPSGGGILLAGPLKEAKASRVVLVGYGEVGENRAQMLSQAFPFDGEHVDVFGTDGKRFRKRDGAVRSSWHDLVAPNPAFAVEHGYPEPAVDRTSLTHRYGIIEAGRVPEELIDQARRYAETQPPSVGARADHAVELLDQAGPGSSPVLRARFAALVASSVHVRDAVLGALLERGPSALGNLEYVARTAHQVHLADVSALAGACAFFGNGLGPVAAGVYLARAKGTNLGDLLQRALDVGVPPSPELKAALVGAAEQSRNQSIQPAGRPARERGPSIEGADPLGPHVQGSGPSLG